MREISWSFCNLWNLSSKKCVNEVSKIPKIATYFLLNKGTVQVLESRTPGTRSF